MTTDGIFEAESDADIARCQPVMAALRPAMVDPGVFVARVRTLMADGYRLAGLQADGMVVACAGYRFGDKLAWGPHVYVDDLVTAPPLHGRGYGGRLLGWLIDQAKAAGCESFHLDSGVQRFAAHRFYLGRLHGGELSGGRAMRISSHHFALDLT